MSMMLGSVSNDRLAGPARSRLSGIGVPEFPEPTAFDGWVVFDADGRDHSIIGEAMARRVMS
jgi:hypothetical protein